MDRLDELQGSGVGVPARVVAVKDNFDEIFEMEIECWCYGFTRFQGDISPELVHRVLMEMEPTFKAAIHNNYAFNLLETADRISRAAREVVHPKEVTFSILVHLPAPFELDEESQFALAQVVDQAEKEYGDVISRLERRWKKLRSDAQSHQRKDRS